MKLSLNWLKDYIDIDLSIDDLSLLLTDIGLEVEGYETIESIPGGLSGVVVGKVVACEKHPEADRLSLTRVDIGKEELLSIVCGAPNVASGQKVLVATIGTILKDKEGKEFKIQRSKIRGSESQGMICAADELGIGNDHSGIMVLSETAEIGASAKSYLGLKEDTVYEIGLTPNRSDAGFHLGVALDVAAALTVRNGLKTEVKFPSKVLSEVQNGSSIPFVVEAKDRCNRYVGATITGIKVDESPDWIKERLMSIGVRPINNVVDITNFVLHEYGQPLHAFDADKIQGEIRVKTLPSGTKFVTLDGTERKLDSDDLMICDGKDQPLCMAGVFGGLESGVIESTSRIFLESACFDGKSVRRTSNRHGLKTESSKIFEKGSDANACLNATIRAIELLKEYAHGKLSAVPTDYYPEEVEPKAVQIEFSRINNLSGLSLSNAEVLEILEALKMGVSEVTDSGALVHVPTVKVEVTREADIIEEIIRIYGINNIPLPSKISFALNTSVQSSDYSMKETASGFLIGAGFREIMGLSLTQSSPWLNLDFDTNQLVWINNTSNSHLDIMRPSLLGTALETILFNKNRQQPDLRFFEFGKSFLTKEGKYLEAQRLSLVMTGRSLPENWLAPQGKPVAFSDLMAWTQGLMTKLGVIGFGMDSLETTLFSSGIKLSKGPITLAEIGTVSKKALKTFGLNQEVFYAELHWDNVLKVGGNQKTYYKEVSKYPMVRRDLAIVIDNHIKYEEIQQLARKTVKNNLKEINLFDIYQNAEQLGEGKKSYALSFVFEDTTKTLRDKDVDEALALLTNAFENKFKAIVRR
jgi:phenylalanyl-tRNA synthetase beta chain